MIRNIFLILPGDKTNWNAGVNVSGLSCNDIEAGNVDQFSREELNSLSLSSLDDIDSCLVLLGNKPVDQSKAEIIWSIIKQVYGSVNEIPESTLRQLGWLIKGIEISEFANLTITDIDTVSAFGIYRNLSILQLTALKESIDEQWSRKAAEDFTNYDLIALRQILCAFNSTEIARIHIDSYRDAASELATLINCQKSVYIELVKLATDPLAFGAPNSWNSIQVASIGCVMAGLLTAKDIPAESMEGISSSIVKCLPTSFLQSMSEEQLMHFTTSAASSFSSSQKNALSTNQIDALENAVKGQLYAKYNKNFSKSKNHNQGLSK